MQKINEVGIKLLEYKEELIKEYPKIVKDALVFSLEQMLNNKVIDLTTYEIIKNESESKDSFKSYLLTKEEFVKTYEELFREYEILRKELNEELITHELLDLKTETIVEKDVIRVLKTFLVDEKFIIDYFGVQETDLIKLMGRKGFVEKFTALRLVKILKDIIREVQNKLFMLKVDNSLVYFNEKNIGYNIDLIIDIDVDDISVLESKDKIITGIKEVNLLAENTYGDKMKI